MRLVTSAILTILVSLCTLASEEPAGKNFLLENFTLLDSYFSHHVIIVEKSTHKLYLFKSIDGQPKHVKTYQIASGKKAGNKKFQGDHRTPEGIYTMDQFLDHQTLLQRHGKQGEIYGVGAFVLNYPNPFDSIDNKSGSGIWLHSTNDETRIDKGLDSRGCVVATNTDLIELSQYIELERTPIIVVHELKYVTKEIWLQRRNEIVSTLQNWLNSWREEDHSTYISHYHKKYSDHSRPSLSAFSQYKKAVFNNPGKPQIDIKNLSVLTYKNRAVVDFLQIYESDNINDTGKKTLYLERDEFYQWKIVSERWSRVRNTPEKETVAFKPSMRFFNTRDPHMILGSRLLKLRDSSESSENLTTNN